MRGQSAIKAHKPKSEDFTNELTWSFVALAPQEIPSISNDLDGWKLKASHKEKRFRGQVGQPFESGEIKSEGREEKLGVEKLTAAFKNVKPTFGQKFKETKIFRTLRFSVLLEGCHPSYSRLVRVLLN